MSGGGKKKEKGGTKRRDGRRWGDGVEREGGRWVVCACVSVVFVRCDQRQRRGGGKEEGVMQGRDGMKHVDKGGWCVLWGVSSRPREEAGRPFAFRICFLGWCFAFWQKKKKRER